MEGRLIVGSCAEILCQCSKLLCSLCEIELFSSSDVVNDVVAQVVPKAIACNYNHFSLLDILGVEGVKHSVAGIFPVCSDLDWEVELVLLLWRFSVSSF